MNRTTIYFDAATPERLGFLSDLDGYIRDGHLSPAIVGYEVVLDGHSKPFVAHRVSISPDRCTVTVQGQRVNAKTGGVTGWFRRALRVEEIRKITVVQPSYHVRPSYEIFVLAIAREEGGYEIHLTPKPQTRPGNPALPPILVATWDFPNFQELAHWIGFELFAKNVTLTVKAGAGKTARFRFPTPPVEYVAPLDAYTNELPPTE